MQYVVLKNHISRMAVLWITIAQPIALYGFTLLKDSPWLQVFHIKSTITWKSITKLF